MSGWNYITQKSQSPVDLYTPDQKQRLEESQLKNDTRLETQDQVGKVIAMGFLPNSDILYFLTETGEKLPRSRYDIFEHADSLTDSLEKEMADADPATIDYTVWLIKEGFRVAKKSGISAGEDKDPPAGYKKYYNPKFEKNLDRRLRNVEKTWRLKGLNT